MKRFISNLSVSVLGALVILTATLWLPDRFLPRMPWSRWWYGISYAQTGGSATSAGAPFEIDPRAPAYGFTCTGDQTASLQAAVNFGEKFSSTYFGPRVKVPQCPNLITIGGGSSTATAISITSALEFVGSGRYATQFTSNSANSSAPNGLINATFPSAQVLYMADFSIELLGTSCAATCYDVYWQETYRSVFENFFIQGGAYGFYGIWPAAGHVRNGIIEDVATNYLYADFGCNPGNTFSGGEFTVSEVGFYITQSTFNATAGINLTKANSNDCGGAYINNNILDIQQAFNYTVTTATCSGSSVTMTIPSHPLTTNDSVAVYGSNLNQYDVSLAKISSYTTNTITYPIDATQTCGSGTFSLAHVLARGVDYGILMGFGTAGQYNSSHPGYSCGSQGSTYCGNSFVFADSNVVAPMGIPIYMYNQANAYIGTRGGNFLSTSSFPVIKNDGNVNTWIQNNPTVQANGTPAWAGQIEFLDGAAGNYLQGNTYVPTSGVGYLWWFPTYNSTAPLQPSVQQWKNETVQTSTAYSSLFGPAPASSAYLTYIYFFLPNLSDTAGNMPSEAIGGSQANCSNCTSSCGTGGSGQMIHYTIPTGANNYVCANY